MMETEKTTNKTAMGSKCGPMVRNMKENTEKEINKDMENFFGLMDQNMKGSFGKMIYMDKEIIIGLMGKAIQECGKTIK